MTVYAAKAVGELAAQVVEARIKAGGVPVAGRAFKPTTFQNLSGNTFQRVLQIYTASRTLRLVYQNMVQTGTPQESSAGPYTLTAEVVFGYDGAGGGVPIVATWGGQSTVTIPTYGIAVSDPITIPWFVTFPSTHVVRSYVTMAGEYLPVDSQQTLLASINEGFIAGDFVGAGNAANSFGGTTRTFNFGPHLVLGDPAAVPLSVYGAGDSIESATGWVGRKPNSFDAQGFLSYFGTQNSVPVLNAARSGETLTGAVQKSLTNATIQRLRLAPYMTDVISNYGTNDLATRTVAQMKADYLAYWAGLSRMGLKVWQLPLLPKASSSNQWTDVAGQTPSLGDPAIETKRQAINQWLRATASAGADNSALFDAAGSLSGVIDTAKPFEVNADGSLIAINPVTGGISNGAGGRWLVDATTYDSGAVSSWTNNQRLNDTSKTWTTDQWWGYTALVTADATTPAAVGQAQDIALNTATQLITNAFATLPSAGASYRIYRRPTIDGTHPATWVHQGMSDVLTAAKQAGLLK